MSWTKLVKAAARIAAPLILAYLAGIAAIKTANAVVSNDTLGMTMTAIAEAILIYTAALLQVRAHSKTAYPH